MTAPNENGPRLTSRPVGAVSEETSLLDAGKSTPPRGDQQGGEAVSDTITLPRKHIYYAAHALEHFNKDAPDPLVSETIHHLRAALAAEPTKKTPAWWMDGLAATLMREGVNKHRAREIAVGYWEAYCQIPGNKEEPT